VTDLTEVIGQGLTSLMAQGITQGNLFDGVRQQRQEALDRIIDAAG
jgi:hypothetical protein